MTLRIGLFVATAMLAACGGGVQHKTAPTASVDMHTAQNSLDYPGVYKANLPAADCPGIAATLTLLANGTYTLHYQYMERDSEFTEKGAYAVSGNRMTLTPAEGEGICCYQIEEGQLRQLDGDNKVIEGALAASFIYKKQVE